MTTITATLASELVRLGPYKPVPFHGIGFLTISSGIAFQGSHSISHLLITHKHIHVEMLWYPYSPCFFPHKTVYSLQSLLARSILNTSRSRAGKTAASLVTIVQHLKLSIFL